MVVRELVALLGVKSNKADFDKAEGGMNRLIGFAKAAAAAYAAFKLGQWIKGIAQEVANLGDRYDKMSKRLGLSTDALQEWGHVATLAGTSINAMETSIRRLQVSADEAAAGTATYADEFKRLGVKVKDQSGKLKSAETLLSEMGDGFARLETHTERVAVAQKLLGRAGSALIPVLMQGTEAIEAQKNEVRDLGGYLDEELIGLSTDYIDNQARLKLVMLGLKNTLARAVLPIFVKLQNAFIEWYKVNGQWIRMKLATVFRALAGVLKNVYHFFGRQVSRFKDLIKVLDPTTKKLLAIGAVAVAIAALLLLPGGSILLLIGLIAAVIDDYERWRAGSKSAIGEIQKDLIELTGIDIVGWIGKIWNGFKLFWEKMVGTAGAFLNFWYRIFTGEKGFIGAVWAFVDEMALLWGDWIYKLIDAVRAAIDKMISMFKNFARKVSDTITSPIRTAFKKLGIKMPKEIGKVAVGFGPLVAKRPDLALRLVKGMTKGLKPIAGKQPELMPQVTVKGKPPAGIINSPQTSIKIDVQAAPGMNEGTLAETIGRYVSESIEKVNRDALRALAPLPAE